MKRIGLLLVALSVLVSAAPADAVRLASHGELAQPEQHWAASSLAPTVDRRIALVRTESEACLPIVDGMRTPCTDIASTIWLPVGVEGRRRALFYELAHWFDFYVMTPASRREFLHLLGPRYRQSAEPWEWDAAHDEPLDESAFADEYAWCSMGTTRQYLNWGGVLSARRHHDVCTLIWRTWRGAL